ncbi:PREDICTED: myelin-associated oligodendrocyte basic protein-like [Chinchilla lanigera]|uniref:myelin-associated oligodendrocyte basic protein-like n=1 Tax=Chinchilla lanigera TaxID=34839 RepID=UPI000699194E|nr:PREDICTED: myelin-associated oligodendrocyte basic protein-like [Chinchilla lanigera]
MTRAKPGALRAAAPGRRAPPTRPCCEVSDSTLSSRREALGFLSPPAAPRGVAGHASRRPQTLGPGLCSAPSARLRGTARERLPLSGAVPLPPRLPCAPWAAQSPRTRPEVAPVPCLRDPPDRSLAARQTEQPGSPDSAPWGKRWPWNPGDQSHG